MIADKLFRSLPAFKGKERLARLLLAGPVKQNANITVAGRHNCSYLLPNVQENVGFDIFINGEYEPHIQELIYKLLPLHGCFLDLGANIGSILIPTAKRRPDICAVGIEAAPWIYEYLKKNIENNELTNIQVMNCALFDADDKELDFFSPQDKFGKGSLSPVFTRQAVKVKSKRVDTLVKELTLQKVDLVKIDVEGFEYFVFKGAENLLQGPDAPVIIFEFVDWAEAKAPGISPGAAQRLLTDAGYLLYRISGNELIKTDSVMETGAVNFLASKKAIIFP